MRTAPLNGRRRMLTGSNAYDKRPVTTSLAGVSVAWVKCTPCDASGTRGWGCRTLSISGRLRRGTSQPPRGIVRCAGDRQPGPAAMHAGAIILLNCSVQSCRGVPDPCGGRPDIGRTRAAPAEASRLGARGTCTLRGDDALPRAATTTPYGLAGCGEGPEGVASGQPRTTAGSRTGLPHHLGWDQREPGQGKHQPEPAPGAHPPPCQPPWARLSLHASSAFAPSAACPRPAIRKGRHR